MFFATSLGVSKAEVSSVSPSSDKLVRTMFVCHI